MGFHYGRIGRVKEEMSKWINDEMRKRVVNRYGLHNVRMSLHQRWKTKKQLSEEEMIRARTCE